MFRVRTDATKPQIRAAVELMFEVKVDKVHVVNQIGKAKRFGRTPGRRSGLEESVRAARRGPDDRHNVQKNAPEKPRNGIATWH